MCRESKDYGLVFSENWSAPLQERFAQNIGNPIVIVIQDLAQHSAVRCTHSCGIFREKTNNGVYLSFLVKIP